jgi:SAM-dependent methyltransferase
MDHRELVYARYRAGLYKGLDPYLELQLRRPYLRRVFKRYVPVTSASRVLDLGCGCGTILHILEELGIKDVQGVDRSSECVTLALESGLNVAHSDIFSFLRHSGQSAWDVIIAFDVLEHLTKDELMEVLDLITKHLAPHGWLVAHVPNGESVFGTRVFSNDITHETIFTRNSLHQVLVPLGYQRIHCYEDAPVVHGAKSALRSLGWAVARTLALIPMVLETGSRGPYILSQTMLITARHEGHPG